MNGGPAGGEIVIELSDTGAGIPANVLPSVCEPFFTTRQEGTGLGLAIAKRYVEQNGGRLEIDSSPGSGTTVRVRLPVGGAA
jgi:signal transduction histidine kinase